MKLVHILKQYSGEPAFSNDNTTKQNSQVLQNFDLADYRQVFCDHAVILYQVIIIIYIVFNYYLLTLNYYKFILEYSKKQNIY